jgi:gentisate 1,2-dioxygenase
MDCYMMRVPKGATTRPKRATFNALCYVASGHGRSTVGDKTFEWAERDIFSIPHWEWASHQAIGGDADIFLATDRVVYERLGILREEMQ